MFDNTISFIDGKHGKALNNACKIYMQLSNVIKDNQTTQKIQNNIIKELCSIGGRFETTKYVITMSYIPDSLDIDKDFLKEKYPDIYAECLRKPKAGYLKLANIKEK